MCFLYKITISDLISIFGIIVNVFIAWFIISKIQKNANNRRILKDHFINEIKEIRNEYILILNEIYHDKCKPQELLYQLKSMDIKVNDLMEIINEKYKKIEKKKLTPYTRELKKLINVDKNFIKSYKENKITKFSMILKNEINIFQKKHNSLFNQVIIDINDS